MKRRGPQRRGTSAPGSTAKRALEADDRKRKRRNERRASWAAGILSVFFASASLAYFLASTGPPYQGRGAAPAAALHGDFGPIGPALPWLAISVVLAFVRVAAARGWGKDVD
jgi:hypothetical protein